MSEERREAMEGAARAEDMALSEGKADLTREALLAQGRDLGTVTVEIRALHRQAQQMVLGYAVEIGRRLVEAKALVDHGDWSRYIKEELGYSQSTANNFARIFEAYGRPQQTLFGAEANCQTFGNLTYSQALALLALPEEEREEFVETHPVESMSTRELQAAIRERDQARAALEAQRTVSRGLQEDKEGAEKAAAALRDELEALKAKAIDVPVAQADPEKIKKAVKAAVAKEQAAAKKAKDKLSTQLDREKGLREELEKKLQAAQARAEEADLAAKAEVEELKRRLAMADPVTAEFKGLFAQASQLAARLLELEGQAPEDKRGNLRAALTALGRTLTKEG